MKINNNKKRMTPFLHMLYTHKFLLSPTGLSAGNATKCPNKTELDTCLGKVAGYMPKSGLPADRKQLVNMCR